MSTPFPEGRWGEYHLAREVGRGAMGIVYEATADRPLGAVPVGGRVALKLLVFPPLLPEGERAALIVRFAREARALAAVRHPNVARVFEVGEVEGQPFMAMEFLVGPNAREWLLRHGPMPPAEAVAFGTQLCDALAAVHAAGIIHRDVKPDNVVLEPDGTVRLTDFGIARMEVEASLTRTGGLVGSPAYMAPEQILGGAIDARSDLFSAGVTLYQMLTGELPFGGAHLMEVAHRVAYEPARPPDGVPAPLVAVLLRALEKNPSHRFADAGEMGAALTAAATEPFAGETSNTGTVSTPSSDFSLPKLSSPIHDLTCLHHPAQGAVATCAECEQPLCRRCVFYRLGRAWCGEHASARVRPLWVTRLEVLSIGLLFAALLWSLYPLRW